MLAELRETNAGSSRVHCRSSKRRGSLRTCFERAREAAGVDFQFRDLRAKVGTDVGNLADARALLGHAAVTTTDRYIRRRAGVVVRLVARKL
jgi:hypothetical protein